MSQKSFGATPEIVAASPAGPVAPGIDLPATPYGLVGGGVEGGYRVGSNASACQRLIRALWPQSSVVGPTGVCGDDRLGSNDALRHDILHYRTRRLYAER
jgi:hypothetical protein